MAEGLEPSISGLTIRRLTNLATPQRIWWTGRDSNPHKKFAGLLCCQLHHQPKDWWLRVELNHQPRAYETLALIRLSYTAMSNWKPAEELNLVPSAQLLRFGLEDRCRERGPLFGGDGEIRTHNMLFTRQLPYQLELHRLTNCGRGVRPTRLCELHGPGTVFVLPG